MKAPNSIQKILLLYGLLLSIPLIPFGAFASVFMAPDLFKIAGAVLFIAAQSAAAAAAILALMRRHQAIVVGKIAYGMLGFHAGFFVLQVLIHWQGLWPIISMLLLALPAASLWPCLREAEIAKGAPSKRLNRTTALKPKTKPEILPIIRIELDGRERAILSFCMTIAVPLSLACMFISMFAFIAFFGPIESSSKGRSNPFLGILLSMAPFTAFYISSLMAMRSKAAATAWAKASFILVGIFAVTFTAAGVSISNSSLPALLMFLGTLMFSLFLFAPILGLLPVAFPEDALMQHDETPSPSGKI